MLCLSISDTMLLYSVLQFLFINQTVSRNKSVLYIDIWINSPKWTFTIEIIIFIDYCDWNSVTLFCITCVSQLQMPVNYIYVCLFYHRLMAFWKRALQPLLPTQSYRSTDKPACSPQSTNVQEIPALFSETVIKSRWKKKRTAAPFL